MEVAECTLTFNLEGQSRMIFRSNVEDDCINFGGGFPSVDADDGTG